MLIISLCAVPILGYFKVPLLRQNNRFLLQSDDPREALQLSFDLPDPSLPVVQVSLSGHSVGGSWLDFLLESIFLNGKEQRRLAVQASVIEVRRYRVHLFNITKQLVEPIFSIYFNPFTKSFELHLQGFCQSAIGFYYQANLRGTQVVSKGVVLQWNSGVKSRGNAYQKQQQLGVDGNLQWLQLNEESLKGVVQVLGECWVQQFLKCRKSVLEIHQIQLYFKGAVRIPLYRLVLHFHQQDSVFQLAVKPASRTTLGLHLFQEYYVSFDLRSSKAAFLRSSLVRGESRLGIYVVRGVLANVLLVIGVGWWMQLRRPWQGYRRVNSVFALEK